MMVLNKNTLLFVLFFSSGVSFKKDLNIFYEK